MDKKVCPTCEDKGYRICPEAWNLTAQEIEKCPDCDIKPGKLPNGNGLTT